MKDTIAAVIRTLGLIEVRGKDNLDYMLGCIRALEQVMEQINRKEDEHGENDGEL